MISDPVFYAVAIPAVILLGLGKGGFAGIGILSLPLLSMVPRTGEPLTLPLTLAGPLP